MLVARCPGGRLSARSAVSVGVCHIPIVMLRQPKELRIRLRLGYSFKGYPAEDV